MWRDVVSWTSDALVLLGCLVMTIGVIGVIRMPDVYGKLHAASKSVFLGVCSILVAAIAIGDNSISARAVLIIGLLLLTTPVSAYEMARAAALEQEPSLGRASEVPVAVMASDRQHGQGNSRRAGEVSSRGEREPVGFGSGKFGGEGEAEDGF